MKGYFPEKIVAFRTGLNRFVLFDADVKKDWFDSVRQHLDQGIVWKNEPRKNLKIKRRGFGDSVVIEMNKGFEIFSKLDTVFSLLLENGCQKQGVLNGQFKFARVSGSRELVPVTIGSRTYKQIQQSQQQQTKIKRIKASQLKPGWEYSDAYGKRIFLGWVSTLAVKHVTTRNFWRNANSYYNLNRSDVLNIEAELTPKMALWFYGNRTTYGHIMDKNSDSRRYLNPHYLFQLTKTSCVVQEHEQVIVPSDEPSKFYGELIRSIFHNGHGRSITKKALPILCLGKKTGEFCTDVLPPNILSKLKVSGTDKEEPGLLPVSKHQEVKEYQHG